MDEFIHVLLLVSVVTLLHVYTPSTTRISYAHQQYSIPAHPHLPRTLKLTLARPSGAPADRSSLFLKTGALDPVEP